MNYKLILLFVFSILLGLAFSEETIEVTVDNTPQPSKEEIAAKEEVEGLKAELERITKDIEVKKSHFQKELTEKMKVIQDLQSQLQLKEKAYIQIQEIVASQKEKIENLEKSVSSMKEHIDRISSPLTFVDFVVDCFESYILPTSEKAIAVLKNWTSQGIAFLKEKWALFVEFWKQNSTCQQIQEFVIKYFNIISSYVIQLWNETIYPFCKKYFNICYEFVNSYLEPYYPTIKSYYNLICEKAVEYAGITYNWLCDRFTDLVGLSELIYTELKKNEVLNDYADVFMYFMIVAILLVLLKLLRLILSPLCWLCPCRWCCCKRYCPMKCCCCCCKKC